MTLCFHLWFCDVSPPVIDVLSLQDSKQNVAAVEKLSGGLSALSDVYVVSTIRLPVKMGGVLFGLYSKQDNRKYLEVAIMGKIHKGWWKFSDSVRGEPFVTRRDFEANKNGFKGRYKPDWVIIYC